MKNQKTRSSHGLRKFWEQHINAWEKTGLTQTEYCRRHNLRPNRFTYWKKKMSCLHSSSQLVQVPHETVQSGMGLFVSRDIAPGLRVTAPSGFSVEVPDGFSPVTLGQVLLILKEV